MKKTSLSLILAFLITGMLYAQEKSTMNVKDLESGIEKYVEKNYKEFKITEAYKYDAVYEMKIQKDTVHAVLVFSSEGKFLYKKTDADKAKVSLQTRSTISLKDVESDISKYIKKNYEGYKITEAFKYDLVYTTKIVKGAEAETLLFDHEGKFIKKVVPAKPAVQVMNTDSVPTKSAVKSATDSVPPQPEMKTEPAAADTTKK